MDELVKHARTTLARDESLIWSRRGKHAHGVSHWWSVCQDCEHRGAFDELHVTKDELLGHQLDGALLLAALDLAEHQGDTGHRRGLLWTGEHAAERAPLPLELGVCAEHPAFYVPQLGGAWTWLPSLPPGACALVPRMFDMHGDGRTLVRGYPAAIPAWADPRHAGGSITAGVPRSDHTQVCRWCSCVTDGSGAHSAPRADAGSSPHREPERPKGNP